MKSFYHLYHETLLHRFKGSDETLNKIQTKFEQSLAGIRGEERVHREIQDSLINTEFILLKNLQFMNDTGFPHQIDLILLTSEFILLGEVKNISGTLYYNRSLRQFSRVRFDGVREHFQNPFDQLHRHHEFLHYLLKNANFKIPIIPLIVNANQNSSLDSSLQGEPILHVSSLRHTFNKLRQQYKTVAPFKTLEKLKTFLESQTIIHEANRYIPADLIAKGVLCPTCNFKTVMHFENRTWRCHTCNKNNRSALKLAIRDYRILLGKEITNRTFRDWTGITNRTTASKMLGHFNFPYTGTYRNRVYTIPQNYMFIENPS